MAVMLFKTWKEDLAEKGKTYDQSYKEFLKETEEPMNPLNPIKPVNKRKYFNPEYKIFPPIKYWQNPSKIKMVK